jgi:hypothetical protein
MKTLYSLILTLLTITASSQYFGEWYFESDAEGWTTSGDGVVFDWTDDGPAPTASIWAVPPLIGLEAGGWMMLDDDALGPNEATDSYFISPVLDLSDAPSQLILEFDQYFQEWETGSDTTQIQVSSDGGINWFTTTINDGVGRTNRPNPEHFFVNITEGIQDDPSNVQIRFRYRADWSYGWQLDNITISELPDYDLVAWEGFTDNILTEYEYSRVPLTQAQDLEVGVVVRNLGALELTGITATLEVTDPQANMVSVDVSSATIDVIPSFGVDTVWMGTGFTPDQLGLYNFSWNLTANEADDEIAEGDENITRDMEMTDAVYSHVFDSELNYSASGREIDDVWNEYLMGNVFEIGENTDLLSVECKLGPETTIGQEIDVWVQDWTGEDPDTGELFLDEVTSYTFIHEITQEDVMSEGYLSINITDQIELLAGGTYIIGLHALGQSDQFWVQCRFSDSDFSTVQWGDFNQAGADWWFGWTYSPSIRVQLGTWVPNVGDYKNEVFDLGQNMPNPASESTRIPFTLHQSASTSLTITDLSGRVVFVEDQGTLPSGTHVVELNAANLASGNYLYTLQANGAVITRKMTIE